jgi:hypothetical protein
MSQGRSGKDQLFDNAHNPVSDDHSALEIDGEIDIDGARRELGAIRLAHPELAVSKLEALVDRYHSRAKAEAIAREKHNECLSRVEAWYLEPHVQDEPPAGEEEALLAAFEADLQKKSE